MSLWLFWYQRPLDVCSATVVCFCRATESRNTIRAFFSRLPLSVSSYFIPHVAAVFYTHAKLDGRKKATWSQMWTADFKTLITGVDNKDLFWCCKTCWPGADGERLCFTFSCRLFCPAHTGRGQTRYRFFQPKSTGYWAPTFRVYFCHFCMWTWTSQGHCKRQQKPFYGWLIVTSWQVVSPRYVRGSDCQ